MTREAPVILAVEDESRNAALLRAVLEPAGYRLAIVGSLAAAHQWLAHSRPDLVLLDVGLPDGNGLDLARWLRAAEGTANVPILVTSARVLTDDQEAARDAGSDDFLPKPLLPQVLLRSVANWLERAQQR